MEDNEQGVTRALASRETVIELISVVVFLTIGINLVTTYVTGILGGDSTATLILGLSFFALPFFYILRKIKNSLQTTTSIYGLIAFDIKQKELVDIPGYHFSEKLGKAVRAAFFENPAYRKMWDDNPLILMPEVAENPSNKREEDVGVTYSAIYSDDSATFQHNAASKLLTEGAEYYVIELLSDHLANYFNEKKSKNESITELTGSDIPQILLTNRFLKLLTTPFEERPIYTQANIPMQTPDGGSLKYIQGSDGSIFSTLSLRLPKDTKISRPASKSGALVLDGKKACIRISIEYKCERTIAPTHFVEMYLGKNPSNIALLRVSVAIDVAVKPTALLSSTGWRLYRWADTLPEKMRKSLDFEAFIDRISWDHVKTHTRVSNILKRIEAKIERRSKNQTG